MRKATLETIDTPKNHSVMLRQFDHNDRNTRPYWHFHPELELVYVNGGSGKRHVGAHLSYFQDGELVLIGSNLPHQGFTHRLNGYKSETVLQMRPDFLGEHFFNRPEMAGIKKLLERSKLGLSFFGKTKSAVGPRIEALPKAAPFDRILDILHILQELAVSEEYQVLNASGFSFEVVQQDNIRLNKVLNYVRQHFQDTISIPDMADFTSMTEPSFCRYFKGTTGKSFTQFLNEYRLVHAVKLLTEENMSIQEVCYASGFNNYSHFTKRFKTFMGRTPSEYRKDVKLLVTD